MAVAFHLNNDATSTTISAGTSAWIDTNHSGNAAQAYRASTGASTIITWTLGSSVLWGLVKCDVIKA
jgi:hypothetical protein